MVPTRKSIINKIPGPLRVQLESWYWSTVQQFSGTSKDRTLSTVLLTGKEHVARAFLRNNVYLMTVQETLEAPLDEPASDSSVTTDRSCSAYDSV